ncbi:hypothetical protein COY07_06340 [Candidatus Peregrinibacteria bacterium CG_4_10_14_0_2_um_filter_43_11]|nr:MAG: hypothetical protein COY07_06340 [Candidatus Peregrinibacteria bacterium CG_4_10_14_0_2_um_filter_43_11]
MNKYIQDFIKDNSRFLLSGLTLFRKKVVSEIIRGFFVFSLKPLIIRSSKTPPEQLSPLSRRTFKKPGVFLVSF